MERYLQEHSLLVEEEEKEVIDYYIYSQNTYSETG
jgi:hypothetical protein